MTSTQTKDRLPRAPNLKKISLRCWYANQTKGLDPPRAHNGAMESPECNRMQHVPTCNDIQKVIGKQKQENFQKARKNQRRLTKMEKDRAEAARKQNTSAQNTDTTRTSSEMHVGSTFDPTNQRPASEVIRTSSSISNVQSRELSNQQGPFHIGNVEHTVPGTRWSLLQSITTKH